MKYMIIRMAKITQEVKCRIVSGAHVITIPEPFRQHIDAEEGTMVRLVVDTSKHGNYVGIWNPEQQQNNKCD